MSDRTDVLLVGAGGPLGMAVARELGDSPLRVVATGRRGPNALDVARRDGVAAALEATSPRVVVYMVNSAGGPPRDGRASTPEEDLEAFITAARGHGLERFVFTSSAAVYGDGWTRPIREDDPLSGTSDYARLKIESEKVVSARADRDAFSAVSLRIFNVFGPGFSRSLVNRVLEGPPPELRLTAGFVRDYVHSRDVARAIASAIDHHDAVGAVNIGSGIALDNVTLAACVPPLSFVAADSPDTPSYSVADTRLAAALLGFDAEVDVREVLRAARSAL